MRIKLHVSIFGSGFLHAQMSQTFVELLRQNSYPIAVTVFVASLVYLLVFDVKTTDGINDVGKEKPTPPAQAPAPIPEDKNQRVPSKVQKDRQAENEASDILEAEMEESRFLAEQRNKVKSSKPVSAPAPLRAQPHVPVPSTLAPEAPPAPVPSTTLTPVSTPAPAPAAAPAPPVPELAAAAAAAAAPVLDSFTQPANTHEGSAAAAASGATSPDVLSPLLVVPNALVYGMTFGQVNLFSGSETDSSTPSAAGPHSPSNKK